MIKTVATYVRDPLLHSGGAVIFTALCLAGGMLPAYAVAMNAGGWAFREWDQTRFTVPPWRWSVHKHIEWLVPGAAGGIVAAIWSII